MADAFYGPRSRENARLLLDTAKGLGLGPEVVRTQAGGYLIPEAVSDAVAQRLQEEAAAIEAAEEAARAAEEEARVAAEAEKQAEEESKRPSQADSKADWLAYATSKGLDVTEDNTKAEIVEAVKKAEETD